MTDGNSLASAHRAVRRRLFRRYLLVTLPLVVGSLLALGAASLYVAQRDHESALAGLQHEKALAAASRIEQHVGQVARQLAQVAAAQADGGDVDARRAEFARLLRQVPELTEIAQLDANGREQIAVSRLVMDGVASGKDRSQEPAFEQARRDQPWYGRVYLRDGTEPRMTVAVHSGGGALTVAELDLKFVWDVVARVKAGERGKAYVVDGSGLLLADPDIGLVLRQTNLSALPHVQAATAARAADATLHSRGLDGTPVLVSMASVEPLDWRLFVEQPLSDVRSALKSALPWLAALLLAGAAASALAASAMARSVARPIRALAEGARRVGEADLGQPVVVAQGDVLEGLAGEFNRMAAALSESFAALQRAMEARSAELAAALEQQSATADILRVISGSMSGTQPVFDKILDSCQRLFAGERTGIYLASADAKLHLAGYRGDAPDAVAALYPQPLADTAGGLAMRERRVVHFPEVLGGEGVPPSLRLAGERMGNHSVALAPMVWQDEAVGCISVARGPHVSFSDSELALLKTFADQAAIAIQNARLFNETKEALERQTATAEVLQVISSSVADTQPVFDTIVRCCQHLFEGKAAALLLPRGSMVEARAFASDGTDMGAGARLKPWPLDRESATGACILEARAIVIGDILVGAKQFPRMGDLAFELGYRSGLFVPLLREGCAIGCIAIGSAAVSAFEDKEIALARTFADQAVIAIQNAQLFRAIQDKSRELELANKHKSEFLANMSHELRTPLNAIIGFSEVLSEQMFGAVNAKQLEYLQDIHSSGHHLLGLINDILDLAKIEAGRMELDLTRFHLPLLLDNAATLVRERALRQGLALALDVEPGLVEWVADERKVKQVVINLLANAVKFTPAGGRVTLRARRTADGAEIAVADTGVGIAPEVQALVFEEFAQVGDDRQRRSEGTGLGLSLAKRFVELHGGTMRVESEPGHGATFVFVLPERVLELG